MHIYIYIYNLSPFLFIQSFFLGSLFAMAKLNYPYTGAGGGTAATGTPTGAINYFQNNNNFIFSFNALFTNTET